MDMLGITVVVLSTRSIEVANEANKTVMIFSSRSVWIWVTQRHILGR